MRIIDHTCAEFEHKLHLPQSFFCSEVPILDIEIANDISSNWKYEDGRAICVGVLLNDKIKISVAETKDDTEFCKITAHWLTEIAKKRPFYSFNRFFEQGVIKGTFGIDLPVHEIKPFNAKGWNKDRFFEELKKSGKIPFIIINDPLKGDGSKCVKLWQNYLTMQNPGYLDKIVEHNVNCLLKESVILKHQDYFRENYNINHRGWLSE